MVDFRLGEERFAVQDKIIINGKDCSKAERRFEKTSKVAEQPTIEN